MDTEFEITLGEDLDSFLGNDPDAIVQIDINASQDAYQAAVAQEVGRLYPEIKSVNFAWGGHTNYDQWQYAQDDPDKSGDWMQYDLEDIEDRIYNRQEFWVFR